MIYVFKKVFKGMKMRTVNYSEGRVKAFITFKGDFRYV